MERKKGERHTNLFLGLGFVPLEEHSCWWRMREGGREGVRREEGDVQASGLEFPSL